MIESVPLSNKELRHYGLTMGAVIAGLFGLLVPLLFSKPFRTWPWALAVSFWSMAICFPLGLRGVHSLWMRFGHVMGKINTTLILSVVYFVLFVPMAIILKLLGRDRLARQWKDVRVSYRVTRSWGVEKERLERPF